MNKNSINYEVSLQVHKPVACQMDILKAAVLSIGFTEDQIIELNAPAISRLSMYCATRHSGEIVRRKLKQLCLKNVRVSIKSLKEKDWRDKWKTEFKSFRLTSQVDVVPVWDKDRYHASSGRKSIYIDTSFAFGTGLHETTRFMANLIERCQKQIGSFLDLGTGTGILTILALHNGAKECKAVDISQDCVNVAKSNLRNNGYDQVDMELNDLQQLSARKKYDYVAANLVTQDLIKLKRKILSFVKPGKYLAVSGISRENFPLLKTAFRQLPLRCLKISKGQRWVAVLYKRLK